MLFAKAITGFFTLTSATGIALVLQWEILLIACMGMFIIGSYRLLRQYNRQQRDNKGV